MDVYKKFVKYSGCFFERSVNEENFSNTVFSVLEKILPLKTGYIFFINQNDLSLKYKTQNVILAGNITDEEFSEIQICGILTDICVISNAILVKSIYPNTPIKIIKNCCATTNDKIENETYDVMTSLQFELI